MLELQLPPRQVEHPLHLQRQSPYAHALPRRAGGWLNHEDAAGAGIGDNDPIEVYNANGVVVCRANVSSRIPKGAAVMYHAPERTLDNINDVGKERAAGRRAQQPVPDPPQADADAGRLRPIQLLLQLLGADRGGPRLLCHRQKDEGVRRWTCERNW